MYDKMDIVKLMRNPKEFVETTKFDGLLPWEKNKILRFVVFSDADVGTVKTLVKKFSGFVYQNDILNDQLMEMLILKKKIDIIKYLVSIGAKLGDRTKKILSLLHGNNTPPFDEGGLIDYLVLETIGAI